MTVSRGLFALNQVPYRPQTSGELGEAVSQGITVPTTATLEESSAPSLVGVDQRIHDRLKFGP
jgi:hypothetical protein